MKRQVLGLVISLFAAFFGISVSAETLLRVAALDGNNSRTLSEADLLALPQVEVRTVNEFVDGLRTFSGPLARDVLMSSGAGEVSEVVLTAANDYQIEVNAAEFFTYDVILALSMDGVPLSRRDKGPIWMIYPMSDFAELRDPVYNSRLIWQLVRMEYR